MGSHSALLPLHLRSGVRVQMIDLQSMVFWVLSNKQMVDLPGKYGPHHLARQIPDLAKMGIGKFGRL
jgi:hypothetical protein